MSQAITSPTGQIRLGCWNCDRMDYDGVDVLPSDWDGIDYVQSYENSVLPKGFSDLPNESCLDWQTHLGQCPDCNRDSECSTHYHSTPETIPMAKPEKTFRLGPVHASIFLNDSQSGPFHTIQVQRRYKDEQSGEWRSSDSFTAQQAASALVVLQQAVAYVLEHEADRED